MASCGTPASTSRARRLRNAVTKQRLFAENEKLVSCYRFVPESASKIDTLVEQVQQLAIAVNSLVTYSSQYPYPWMGPKLVEPWCVTEDRHVDDVLDELCASRPCSAATNAYDRETLLKYRSGTLEETPPLELSSLTVGDCHASMPMDLEATDDVKVCSAGLPVLTEQTDAPDNFDAANSDTVKPSIQSELNPAMLESLKTMPKHEAILNLFLNRSCTISNYEETLDNLRKYFQPQEDYTSQFLGEKFGFRCSCFGELCEIIRSEVDGNAIWSSGLTLGMVLAQIRKDRSSKPPRQGDSQREITDRLTQPKKNKQKRK